jgi:flagellar hook-associated protein 3 FlgL
MTIRVTLGMLNNQFVRNLNNNMLRTETLQNQLASGKMINAPSDDPVGITFAMRYRSEIAANDQYKLNLSSAVSFLENVDTTLDQTNSLWQRVRELTVQAMNDTNSAQSRESIAQELDQLRLEFINVGNTSYNGKFMFSGQTIDVRPYDGTVPPEDVITDTAHMEYEVGVGTRIPVNLTGNEVFGFPDDEDNVFTIMRDLTAAVRAGNVANMNEELGNIDTRMDKILGNRAVIGARVNRLEFVGTRLADIELNLTKLQSEVEDANMGELITLMKTNESVYQASLATGAKIIQPSLIDFLR